MFYNRHDISEILLKVALNIINQLLFLQTIRMATESSKLQTDGREKDRGRN